MWRQITHVEDLAGAGMGTDSKEKLKNLWGSGGQNLGNMKLP